MSDSEILNLFSLQVYPVQQRNVKKKRGGGKENKKTKKDKNKIRPKKKKFSEKLKQKILGPVYCFA